MSDLDSAVSFCADLGRTIKTALVVADGIGAEVAPMLLAVRDDELVGRVTFSRVESFVAELGLCGVLMRGGWGADALVLLSESYGRSTVEEDEAFGEVENLARRFASGDPSVLECLVLLGVGVEDECVCVVLPYKVGFGRVVRFEPTQQFDAVEDGDSVRVLCDAMQVTPWKWDEREVGDRETLELLTRSGMQARLM